MPVSYALRAADPAKTRSDALIVGIVATPKGPVVASGGEAVAAAYGRRWSGLLAGLSVTGKAGEITKIPSSDALNAPLLVLVGLGTASPDAVPPALLRAATGNAARMPLNADTVALALPARDGAEVSALVEGWMLGGYRFDLYKSAQKTPTTTDTASAGTPNTVSVLSPAAKQAEVVAAFERGQRLAVHTAQVRDWVNTPGSDLTPPAFADAVVADVAQWRTAFDKDWKKAGASFSVEVFDEHRLAELECGGILGVGQGSSAAPRMVKLTWAPAEPTHRVALVGKGVTFDTGGLTIKPAGGMHEMKSDMAGAATVINAVRLAAELGLPVHVEAWAPMAENMVSGLSYRPGDVLRMHNGLSVEIRNTDAEGRLLLADALSMAVESEPDVVLDVATLTGHMVMALGDRITGVLGDDAIVEQVLAAGEAADEAMWRMPITDEVKQRVNGSPIADVLQHDWVRWGGGLMAAAFLAKFTAGVPWAHLDIAGPSYLKGNSGHLTAGGTGVSLATLVAFLTALGTAEAAAALEV